MHFIIRWSAVVIASIAVAQSGLSQVSERVIPFDRKVPISERLRQDDTAVVVKRNPSVPFIGSGSETLQEEIERLSKYESIALVRVIGADGELVDNGTWIRTQLRAEVIQLVKGDGSAALERFSRMSHDGGMVRIGGAVVSAGAYPVFVTGENYLIFPGFDRARKTTYPSAAFHVTPSGVLEPMRKTDGTVMLLDSNLLGRGIAEVATALARGQ